VRIEVGIDRLVLDGVELSQRERALLPAAVETELARRLAGGRLGDVRGSGTVPQLPVVTMQAGVRPGASGIAAAIAASVAGGLRQ
jgi:hypothetical protein